MREGEGRKPGFYRYFPFALFMAFIGVEEAARYLQSHGLITLGSTTLYYIYPVKVVSVGYVLFRFRAYYHEISLSDLKNIRAVVAAGATGLLVFLLWIQMDWAFGVTASPGFNPTLFPGTRLQVAMTLFRVSGAVLVVPLMEELFWRSFLIRYIINVDFQKIPVGVFSWGSFLLTVGLFGLEHNFILAGIMAGVFYNLILYKTRSIAQCILGHAVTNLALAVYVVGTGKWHFW